MLRGMAPDTKAKLGLGLATDYSYLTMVSLSMTNALKIALKHTGALCSITDTRLLNAKRNSDDKDLCVFYLAGELYSVWRAQRPERLLQHPVSHEGPHVHRDWELGDLQAAGCHPAHGQPALRGYNEWKIYAAWWFNSVVVEVMGSDGLHNFESFVCYYVCEKHKTT